MKKFTIALITVLLLLSVGQIVFAEIPDIDGQSQFDESVYTNDGETYYLNDDADYYEISGTIVVQNESLELASLVFDLDIPLTLHGAGAGDAFKVDNFTINGTDGTVITIGGRTNNRTSTLYSNSITQNGGSIIINSTAANNTYGIYTKLITQTAGSIEALGDEAGEDNYAIYTESIIQTGGTIKVTGGRGINSLGIFATKSITQDDGTIEAHGGAGRYSFGISTESITQTGGAIEAYGGGEDSFGISTDVITQTGGNIKAYGSTTAMGIYGINTKLIEQNGGTIEATGGGLKDAYGIYADAIIVNNATLIANGGTSANNYDDKDTHGIYTNSIEITSGAIYAHGGLLSAGIHTTSITIIDGYIRATGGNRTGYGIANFSSTPFYITQNGGIIEVNTTIGASPSPTSYGIISTAANSSFYITQNGGSIIVKGYGILSENALVSLITQNDGFISAEGGSGISSLGISGMDITQNGGIIIAAAGSGENAIGIKNKTILQRNGSISAFGGSAATANGIDTESLTQNGGTITAYGGTSERTFGIKTKSLTQNDGTITAYSGTDVFSYGISASESITQNGGTIISTGSNFAVDTPGIYSPLLTQNGGTIISTGGKESYGSVFSTIVQNEGTIISTGGSGRISDGIFAMVTTQNGGTIIATGSVLAESGFYSGYITQNKGTIIAIGGNSPEASGIYSGKIEIHDTLIISREGRSTSLTFFESLVFHPDSTLITIVDLSKDPSLASGLIFVPANFMVRITIHPGAILSPQFNNTYMLKKEDSSIEIPFIVANRFSPIPEFDIEQRTSNTITMSYVAEVGNNTYYFLVKRELTPREAFEKANAQVKHTNLVGDIYDFLTESDNAKTHGLLIETLDRIDNSYTVGEAISSIYESVSSSAYGELINWNSVARREFNNNFMSLNSKIENLPTEETKIWADASISFGKITGKSEQFTNAMLGYANKFGKLFVAAQLNASFGNVASNNVLSTKQSFGAMAMAKYTYEINSFLNPGASVVIGYTYGNLENTAKQNSFDIGLHLSNKFYVIDKLTIEPVIGVNFILSSFNEFSYNYDNASETIPKTSYNYLLLNANLNISYAVTEFLSANLRGFFNYDVLKNDFNEDLAIGDAYAITNALDANTISYGVGVDALYTLPSGAITVNLGYLLYMSENYSNHQVKLGINTTF